MKVPSTDVTIVGAGPAGSSLGLQLARAGYQVTLIERSRFPRIKVCGDYLCASALDALRDLGVADSVLGGAHPIRSITLAGFGAQLRLQLPGTGARSLPRETLDERLLAQANAAAARVLRGVYLGSYEENGGVRVAFRDASGATNVLNSRVLIGADGAWSAVAQRNGMVGDRRRTGRWAVGGQLPDATAGDELTMYVGPEGYYARNPLNASFANSMLVLQQPALPKAADAIVERITGGRQSFESAKIAKPLAIGPLRYRASRVAKGRILLTGDAAELLDPFTGQGVATALTSSFIACEAVTALLAGEPSVRVERRYSVQWRSAIAPRRMLSRLVNAIVGIGVLRNRALRGIQRDPSVALELLASVSGVEPVRNALTPRTLRRLFVA